MAVRVQAKGKRVEYVLEEDRGSSEPTVFVFRPLTWEENLEVQEASPMTLQQAAQINEITSVARAEKREITEDEAERINAICPVEMSDALKVHRQHAIGVRYALIEIRGLKDLEGQPVKMSANEFVRVASPRVLTELYNEVISISRFSEDAVKK